VPASGNALDAPVPLWHRHQERKIAGMSAPRMRDLVRCLEENPDCEVYTGQDHVANEQKPVVASDVIAAAGYGHVTLWHRVERRKIAGNASPLAKNADRYLMSHPDCEVYTGQDQLEQQVGTSLVPHSSAHAVLWHTVDRRKIAGNAAPLNRNLDKYLLAHPECEAYTGQDGGTPTVRRASCPKRPRPTGSGAPRGLTMGTISIWNRAEKRKITGNAAPLVKNVDMYLAKRPDCEVYANQDGMASKAAQRSTSSQDGPAAYAKSFAANETPSSLAPLQPVVPPAPEYFGRNPIAAAAYKDAYETAYRKALASFPIKEKLKNEATVAKNTPSTETECFFEGPSRIEIDQAAEPLLNSAPFDAMHDCGMDDVSRFPSYAISLIDDDDERINDAMACAF
jgi:hypothetical protein